MKHIIWLLVSVLASGCAQLGPKQLQTSRNDYNIAIQKTSDEQLLLNLVRLQYRDTPLFLKISSVSSQFKFESKISGNGFFSVGSDSYGLGTSVSFTETPTISFTPLQGDSFVQRLLTPIEIDTVLLLIHSGWRIDRVLRLCVQRLNGIKNASSASGPTPSLEPTYKEFIHITNLLRTIQNNDNITFGYDEQQPVLQLLPSPSTSELLQLLKLKPNLRYKITNHIADDVFAIGTRSLLGVMFFMSQAVEVPNEHKQSGKVTITKTSNGLEFDWKNVTGGLLRIHSNKQKPTTAVVAIQYRDYWFYLDDSDLDSKSTFSLLSQLFALQAGKVKTISPMLTLPIGG